MLRHLSHPSLHSLQEWRAGISLKSKAGDPPAEVRVFSFASLAGLEMNPSALGCWATSSSSTLVLPVPVPAVCIRTCSSWLSYPWCFYVLRSKHWKWQSQPANRLHNSSFWYQLLGSALVCKKRLPPVSHKNTMHCCKPEVSHLKIKTKNMTFSFQEGLVFCCLYWHFSSALFIFNLFVLLWKKNYLGKMQ